MTDQSEGKDDFNLKTIKLPLFLKKHWPLILLAFILLFGFYLRSYHLDYPAVGYHNWKETHYLTEARNFERNGFFDNGFFIPQKSWSGLGFTQDGLHADTFPITSILAGIMFIFFGFELWAARLPGLLLNAGTIIFIYLLVKRLFDREDLALVSAFLFAINPLYVFFSHNVQLMNPAIFCMIASAYFFVVWSESLQRKHLFWAVSFLTIATLAKYSFFVIVLPIAAILPWKKLLTKQSLIEQWKNYAISIAIFALVPLWVLYNELVLSTSISNQTRVVGNLVFQKAWWNMFKIYTMDNLTIFGLWLSLVGLVFLILFLRKKHLAKGNRFLLAYAIAFFPFIYIMSSKLQGHSYHYFPIIPAFVLLIAYGFVSIANILSALLKKKWIAPIILILLCLPFQAYPVIGNTLYGESKIAIDRQFNWHAFGLDTAGEYMKTHKAEQDGVMFTTGQNYGVMWHGDINGVGKIPSPTEMQDLEKEYNFNWIFVYANEIPIVNDPVRWPYISENYQLAQIGFLTTSGQPQIHYMLLKRGGTFNFSELPQLIGNKPPQTRTYEFTSGTLDMQYVNVI